MNIYKSRKILLLSMEQKTGEEKFNVCRLCLKIKNKSNCEPLQQGFIAELLGQLSLKIDLLNIADPVICDSCVVKLQESAKFKILWAQARKKPQNSSIKLSEICIICLTATKQNCLNNGMAMIYIDVLLKKHIPALDNVNRNNMCLCQPCYTHLHCLDDLIAASVHIENRIKNYLLKNVQCKRPVKIFELLPHLLNNQHEDNGSNETPIVAEIDVEDEVKPKIIKSVDLIVRSEPQHPNKVKKKVSANKNRIRKKDRPTEGVVMYKTDEGLQRYKCTKCHYENRYKWQVVRHYITHKSILEVEQFKCKECDFVTKYKASLIVHDLVHRSTEEIPMYKCPLCDYQAKIKRNVLNHSIVHKSMNEIPIYECDLCPFYSKFKPSLTKHKLIHKDIMEVQMFQCAECIYVTKFKKNLKKHMFVHKNPADVKLYKCEVCNFSTKFPYSLKKHAVIHKDPSEVQMYKCTLCTYQTKFKYSLFRHNLIHKSPSELMMFQCDHCPYQTKLKANLESHRLRHLRPDDDQMYKCEYCSYKCKFKHAITLHALVHSNDTDVFKYHCEHCPYKTMSPKEIAKHVKIHNKH